MILTFIITIADSFFSGLAALTSGIATLPAQLVSALNFIGGAIGALNYILPVVSWLDAMYLVLLVEGAIWLFVGGVWIYRHIPFIGH